MRTQLFPCSAALSAIILVSQPALAPAVDNVVADLTKATPGKSNNSYNLGPTGALGWMNVQKGMTVNSRQILITAVEKGSPRCQNHAA